VGARSAGGGTPGRGEAGTYGAKAKINSLSLITAWRLPRSPGRYAFAYFPDVRPAIRPNTEPDIRPAPPR